MPMVVDKESILKACAVLDLIEAGWQPSETELGSACYLDRWGLLPATEGAPFLIIGYAPSLPDGSRILVSPVFVIDRAAKWAWIADQWIVVGKQLEEAMNFDADVVQRAVSAWLRTELQRTLMQAAP